MKDVFENSFDYLNSPVTSIKGIGAKKAELFKKLGISTVHDIIYFFPRNYEDRRRIVTVSECVVGQMCCIKVRPVKPITERRLKSKLSVFLLYAADLTGYITIKWFSAPFCKPKLTSSDTLVVYGKLTNDGGRKQFEMHYMEKADEQKYTGVIVPLYHATAGLTTKTVSETVRSVFSSLTQFPEPLPERIIKKYGYPDINEALNLIHFPLELSDINRARGRFVYEELLVMQLALFHIRERRKYKTSYAFKTSQYIKEFASTLPFEFTADQKNVINDICADLMCGKPMNRLVQGDVGSGKTAVAAAAMYATAKNGFQCALMAPTEILATQHYNTLKAMFPENIKTILITSSVKNKKQIYEDVKNGVYDVVVGTHAVIQKDVTFNKLALCITDEQHRFGVNQRSALSSKGENPHILVMSATPIPRTLSLILYGDLDISVIKSMPRGRIPVETFHVGDDKALRVYNFILKHVECGEQCYIVCPLVEESEMIEAVSVQEKIEQLSNGPLNGLRISCLHGKMAASEKEKIMNSFKNGEIDVLISTTVIEVGVDVPNATLMVIENAERFGLAQLHQLRGRVGRGDKKSYCILISDAENEVSEKRMKIMTETSDGFVISQKDLELRGCGQFFGTRQHGLPELKIANLFSDIDILKNAQKDAEDILKNDPRLESVEMRRIKARIDNLFEMFKENDIFN